MDTATYAIEFPNIGTLSGLLAALANLNPTGCVVVNVGVPDRGGVRLIVRGDADQVLQFARLATRDPGFSARRLARCLVR